MAWRTAKSLEVLRSQINIAYPARDKSSDGTIGNEEHSARESDHNPTADGVVCALDITHDPAHGVDAGALAERLRLSHDKRIKYIISNGRIANYQAIDGEAAWAWRPYHGTNDHRHHFHVSVRPEPSLYDNDFPWVIGGKPVAPAPLPPLAINRYQSITATTFGGAGDANASAYGGQVDPNKLGVALPFRFPGPLRPKVRVFYAGKSVVCDIVDVGPWNVSDPYWQTLGARPQAETGRDLGGRPTNLAGIDLTPAAVRALGLPYPWKGKVDWEFVGAVAPPVKPPVKPPAKQMTIGAALIALFGAIGAFIMEHPFWTILAIAGLGAAIWFGVMWYRNRKKNAPAANVEANVQPSALAVPVFVPPVPYLAPREAMAEIAEAVGMDAVRQALAVKHKPKSRRKPARHAKANKRKPVKRKARTPHAD